jgi:hypothetical protein
MTMTETRRERSCTNKRAFKTARYAELFLENVLRRTGELDVYQCEFCGDYHLGHASRIIGGGAADRETGGDYKWINRYGWR